MDVTILGPQRRTTVARTAVAELVPDGPVAMINAGWREREPVTDEFADVLGGRMVNLELYRRWIELTAADPDYATAERRLTELLAELQEIYALRLQHAMAAVHAVGRRTKVTAVHDVALADAVRAVRDLDDWHLRLVAETRHDFYRGTMIGERDSVLRHRAEIARILDGAGGLVVAGGHVGVLLHVLHIFGLRDMVGKPLITWSAGAMALSDRVLLFHDQGPPGRRVPELYAEGLGVFGGVVVFPHPKRRLRLADEEQARVLAQRLAPRTALLLADGARVDLRDGQPLPVGARWVDQAGRVRTVGDDDGQG